MYQNFKEVLQDAAHLAGLETWEEYRHHWQLMLSRWEVVESLFSKMTINDLTPWCQGRTGKKSWMVKRATDGFFTRLAPNTSGVWMMEGRSWNDTRTDKELQLAHFEKWDAAKFAKHLEEKAAKEKSLANPITLNDYHLIHQENGGLTDKQYLDYCKLVAITRVQRHQAKKVTIQPRMETPDGAEIVEAYHAKKETPLYVVRLGERVSAEEYRELLSKAKLLGGYYSKYSKAPAVPGFQFESMEAARKFTGAEEINYKELEDERARFMSQTRSERLRELAQRWREQGEESLNIDRLDNTPRRARIAAAMEADALKKIDFAATLEEIANQIEMGEAGALQGLMFATDLETLYYIRSRAYYSAPVELRENYEFSIARFFKYVKAPTPTIHRERLMSWGIKLQSKKGVAMAAKKIYKKGENSKDPAPVVLGIRDALMKAKPHLDKWDQKTISEAFADYDRVMRMGLTSLQAIIGALQALEEVTPDAAKLSEKIKARQIDRQFIGKKIDGFFPTPEPVVSLMLDYIDFPAGCTVRDPSAGLGHIARFIPGCDCLEINFDLVEALREKGFKATQGDFLQSTDTFDRFVMNPPFENRQDEAHVRHAWSLLTEKGKLASIVANNKEGSEFKEWVYENGGRIVEIPEGSFQTAFRPTGVSTRLVVMEK